MALRSISLCSGIGGIDLGLAEWARTVCYVERESFPASVLVARMEEASLDPAPIWSDLRTFDARAWRGGVDLVTGGYPCQPFSVAGKRLGHQDERHLWPEVRRILVESGASLGFFENVSGHVSLGLKEVLEDLAASGFDAEWSTFRASEVGAPHRRDRLFILAFRRDEGLGKLADAERARRSQAGSGPQVDAGREPEQGCGAVDDPHDPRLEGRSLRGRGRSDQRVAWPPGPADRDGWERWCRSGGPQPVLRRGVDGIPDWVDRTDRLRALGNAVVPAQARAAFQGLVERILC